jgi:hypothetical protein
MAMLERLISPFREFGWLAGFAYLVDRALNLMSGRFRLRVCEIMVQPITDRPLLTPALARNLELREIRRGDPECALMPVPEEINEYRFSQNAVCLGLFRRTEFMGYIWFSFGRYDEDDVRCNFELSPPSASVFDFDLFLFPGQRMGLGFAGTWHLANTYLRSRGIEYTFSRVSRFNLPSRRAHRHLGSRLIGRALFLQLATLELMVGTIYPYVHLSIAPSSRVCLRIGADVLRS